MIPRQQRLVRMKEFDTLFQHGVFLRASYVGLRVWRVDTNMYPRFQTEVHTKIGFVVSKQVSKHAVVRNRIKRQFRAILRQQLATRTLVDGYFVAIVAFSSAKDKTTSVLAQDIASLFQRAHLYDRTHS